MMKQIKIKGLDEVKKLADKIDYQYKFLQNLDGQTIKIDEFIGFLPSGSYLHKTEDSAKFERDNKEVFMFIRSLESKLRDLLR